MSWLNLVRGLSTCRLISLSRLPLESCWLDRCWWLLSCSCLLATHWCGKIGLLRNRICWHCRISCLLSLDCRCLPACRLRIIWLPVCLVVLCSMSRFHLKFLHNRLDTAFVAQFRGLWLLLYKWISLRRYLPLCKHLEAADSLKLAILLLFEPVFGKVLRIVGD